MAYTYVIERAAADFVLSRTKRDQRALADIFSSLARQPDQPADFTEPGPGGRELRTRFAGPFSITYWIDHAVTEIRIAVVRED